MLPKICLEVNLVDVMDNNTRQNNRLLPVKKQSVQGVREVCYRTGKGTEWDASVNLCVLILSGYVLRHLKRDWGWVL